MDVDVEKQTQQLETTVEGIYDSADADVDVEKQTQQL